MAGTLSAGLGAVALNHAVLGNAFEDRITPINGAIAIFTDDDTLACPTAGCPDGLSFTGSYKVVFLSFPLEAYGTPAQKADVVSRVMSYFGP